MKQVKLIEDMLDEATTQSFAVTFEDNVLIPSDFVKRNLEYKYSCFSFFGETVSDFLKIWGMWNLDRAQGLKRVLDTFSMEYNPIENYDRNEDETDVYGERHVERQSGERTATTDYGQTVADDENRVSAFNSSVYENNTQSTSTVNAHTDTSVQNAFTDVETENAREDRRTSRIHGNIGVTTSQQMIESEFELRRRTLFDDYISDFAFHYLFIVD